MLKIAYPHLNLHQVVTQPTIVYSIVCVDEVNPFQEVEVDVGINKLSAQIIEVFALVIEPMDYMFDNFYLIVQERWVSCLITNVVTTHRSKLISKHAIIARTLQDNCSTVFEITLDTKDMFLVFVEVVMDKNFILVNYLGEHILEQANADGVQRYERGMMPKQKITIHRH